MSAPRARAAPRSAPWLKLALRPDLWYNARRRGGCCGRQTTNGHRNRM